MPDFTDLIRQAVANNNYFLTDHAITQKDERGIEEQEIREVILHGEVIERYPQAYPCPSCLFMHPVQKLERISQSQADVAQIQIQEPLYAVCAYDEARQEARVVTVHWMDPDKWIDPRTRRR